jgi:hypothetical protein
MLHACLQLEGLLQRLNGFLIPGGAANLRPGAQPAGAGGRVCSGNVPPPPHTHIIIVIIIIIPTTLVPRFASTCRP